jgi:hypothetical protein
MWPQKRAKSNCMATSRRPIRDARRRVVHDATGFFATVQAEGTLCSLTDESTREIVLVRPSDVAGGRIQTVSHAPLTKGEDLLLLVSTDAIGKSTCSGRFTGDTGCAPVSGTINVRVDGGAFHPFTATNPDFPSMSGNRLTQTVPPVALHVTLPQTADRLELYLHYERWIWAFTGDVSMKWDHAVAADGSAYVSNFGKNFSIGVH